MSFEENKSIIERFLTNSSDFREAEIISEFLSTNDEALDSIHLFEDLEPEEILEVPVSQKLKVVSKILDKKNGKLVWFNRLVAAACFIGVLLFSVWYFTKSSGVEGVPKGIVISENHVKNYTDELMNYTLPDSSKLILKSKAEIVFKSNFNEARNIEVKTGEVYFDVAKNKHKPFVVTANDINTTALGTEFWVQNHNNNNTLSINLVEGRVQIESIDSVFKMNQVFLSPGQICNINKESGKVIVTSFKKKGRTAKSNIHADRLLSDLPENEIVWTNSDMQFTNATLRNIFSKLENRYSVKIVFEDDQIANSSLTGKIFYSDSLDVILSSICDINKLVYERRNDSIILKKENRSVE